MIDACAQPMRSGPEPRWWNWYRLPLMPQFRYRAPDKWNTASYYFHWLVFRAWTSDAPMLGFSVELTDRSLDIRLNLPYLWAGIFIPVFPEHHNRFWRRPQGMKENSDV